MKYISTQYGALPKIGLGTFSIPQDTLEEIIPVAIKMGYTLFDTACKYHNEDAIGNTLIASRTDRKSTLLQTKVHAELLLGNLRYLRLNGISIDKAWRNACNRLKTDYLDILMLHCTFPDYEKRLKALTSLKRSGKIRLIGICNISLEQLTHLEQVKLLPDVVQVEIHPYFSNKPIIEFCHAHNIVVEARSPFAHGDAMEEWMNEEMLQNIAKKNNASIPQIVLSWIAAQDVIALPRTSSIKHLKENIESLNIKLTEDEMSSIDTLNRNQSYGFVSSRSTRL